MKKHDYQYIKQYIESFYGYKLLDTLYKNAVEKLSIQCPNNHIFEMRFNDFQQGHRCSICSGLKKHNISYVKQYIESFEGYKLLSTVYINSKEKLSIRCPENHIFKIKFNDFQQGHRCGVCRDNFIRYSYKYIKKIIELVSGYELISEKYKNSNGKLLIRCPYGHIFKMGFGNFHFGHRCPICWKNQNYSKGEKEIFEYIKQIYDGKIIPNDKTQLINPNTGKFLELDVWMPEINKAVEYNGEYWHSLENVKNLDVIKKEQCKMKNIDLLVIQENDWIKNKNWEVIDDFVKVSRTDR